VERFLLSLTCLMVFTRNPYFGQMLSQLSRSMIVCYPYLAITFLTLVAFAQVCRDVYHGSDPKGYFKDLGTSMVYMLQIWTGNGFGIMWDQWFYTNFASALLFNGYMFFQAMLFSNLVLGVIIGVFSEVEAIGSARVFDALSGLNRDMTEAEKEILLADFLSINWQLLHVHSKIDELEMLSPSELETSHALHPAEAEVEGTSDEDEPNEDEGDQAGPVWEERLGSDGRLYYYNTRTEKSQWDKPSLFDGVAYAPEANAFGEQKSDNGNGAPTTNVQPDPPDKDDAEMPRGPAEESQNKSKTPTDKMRSRMPSGSGICTPSAWGLCDQRDQPGYEPDGESIPV